MEQRDEVVQTIIKRTCVLFEKTPDDLSENTSFGNDLGAKSGNVTQMTTFLEDEYDIEIPFMEFIKRNTIGDAADYIVELLDE